MTANVNANVHANGKHKDVPLFQHLKPLLATYQPPCLSLYQPTYRQYPDSQQNVVRFRNLLKKLKQSQQMMRR